MFAAIGAIGAKHWSVRVREERNQWWCENENAWVEIFCDSENRGYELKAEVFTKKEALKTALFFVNLIAGKELKNHYLSFFGEVTAI